MRAIDWLSQLMLRRTDARPVAVVRIVVGLGAIGFALEAWVNMGRVLTPQVVDMPYVAWYPRLPLAALPVFIGLWLAAALGFALGLRARLCGAILSLCMAYTLFFDQQLYSNHLYLATLVVLLLTIADSGACCSLDARRSGSRHVILEWPLLLLKIQISIVYFYAALLKINPQYLSGSTIASFWPFNQLMTLSGSWSLVLPLIASVSILTEFFLAVALWIPRLRWFALAVGVGFHMMIIWTGGSHPGVPDIPFAIFAMVTVAPYALFFDFPRRRVAAQSYSG
ncbi:MAG TPA: HTTM domain-containing protein [Roseiflexaceae bacterium]|nr:HTTM domain-containing protein [Roseiflexaceae bacterium]